MFSIDERKKMSMLIEKSLYETSKHPKIRNHFCTCYFTRFSNFEGGYWIFLLITCDTGFCTRLLYGYVCQWSKRYCSEVINEKSNEQFFLLTGENTGICCDFWMSRRIFLLSLSRIQRSHKFYRKRVSKNIDSRDFCYDARYLRNFDYHVEFFTYREG